MKDKNSVQVILFWFCVNLYIIIDLDKIDLF